MKNTSIHTLFEIGLVLKAINSSLEILGGIAFLFIHPITLKAWLLILSSFVPNAFHGLLSEHTVSFAEGISRQSEHFAAFYLLSHGLSKMFLIISIWKHKIWAYPAMMGLLTFFCIYQKV